LTASPKIVVLGAGSVGCFIGGAWHLAGLDVSFIGRESVRAQVARSGMTLTDLEGWSRRIPAEDIHFSTKPAALAKADIVLLCVKSPDTGVAAKQIALHAKRNPAVISFQNGLNNAERLRKLLPKLDILQGMVPFNIAAQGQGRWHKGVSGELVVQDGPLTRELASRIGDGPASLQLGSDMEGIAWGKILVNLNNAVNALSGRTLLDQLKERDYRRVVAASQMEALELLDAARIEPAKVGPVPPRLLPHAIAAPDLIFRGLLLHIQKIDAKARSSMADDLAAGRETEIEYLNGEVVKLATRLGRKAPVNAAIVKLVKQAEAGIEKIWSPADLRAHVLEGRSAPRPFGY
jgi:2-dehydropantoate 2-reductase